MPDAPPAAPVPLQMKDLLGEANLADRGWAKDYADKPLDKDTATALLKKLDGAESLIGRKIGIPGDDAKPEELEKFYSTLRPAKADDYEIKLGEKPDEEFVKVFRAAAHKAGMSKKQLAELTGELSPVFAARAKAAAEAQAASDKEFEQLAQTLFGADKDKAFERVKAALEAHAPAAVKAHIGRLDNNNLALVAGVVDAIIKKYVPEADMGGGKGGSTDTTNLREEGRKLMASPEYRDPFHPKHAEVKAKVDALYAQLAKK